MAGKSTATGLSQNAAGALAYLLGFVTGIVFLIIEKENKFVRFHAMQSTILFGGYFIISMFLNYIPFFGWTISYLLSIAGLILWVVLMWKAYNGEEYELPYIGKIAKERLGKL